MASWLVHLSSDQLMQVRALQLLGILHCILRQDSLFSQCLSPPGCINGKLIAGGNSVMDLHPIGVEAGGGGGMGEKYS